jgi:hypothetical protein
MSEVVGRSFRRQVRAAAARVVRLPIFGERCGVVAGLPLALMGRSGDPARLRRVAMFLAVAGNLPMSKGLVRGAARSTRPDVLAVAHGLADAQGQDAVTDTIEQRLRCRGAEDLLATCRAQRLTRAGAPTAAIDLLRSVDRLDARWATCMADALSNAGRFEALAAHVRDHGDLLPATERVRRGFESRQALGCDDDAAWHLVDISPDIARSPALIGVLFDADPDVRADLVTASRQLGASTSVSDADAGVAALFQLGMIDEVLDHDPQRLGASGRQVMASAYYVRREFTRSRRLLATTRGTIRHWDSEKLEARIRLEEGDFAGVMAMRRGRTRIPPVFDEVRLYAQLHLGEFEEAFGAYVVRGDRAALHQSFTDRSEDRIEERCEHRFVIAQDGPGDELLGACGYGSLATLSSRLTITCDPRLTPLLRRSFPGIEFVPVTRLRRRVLSGWARSNASRRADGPLFRLLTEEAAALASRSDRVTLGRTIPGWALRQAPYPAYLSPDPDLVEGFASRCRGRVGLVWRSELMDPMRQIHYVQAADLAPLTALPASFVCLQHDATSDERATLSERFGDRIDWLDDVDLRDDFESTAAVVATCDLVVGIGTTVTELAAAVGTRTIALHPTRWGTWRGRGTTADVWHTTVRLAAADDYDRPETCVTNAVELANEALSSSRGSVVPGTPSTVAGTRRSGA